MKSHDVYLRLQELRIALPPLGAPAATYSMASQSGNLVHLSGHIARRDGAVWKGKLGATLSTEQGHSAARLVAIDLLASLHGHLGDLNRVRQIVRLGGMVNSTPDFTEQHLVMNGASELFVEVFADRGRHARSAFGVVQIPMGACVEIELFAEVR